MSDAWKWTLSLVATAAVVAASYFWFDRPLALLAHAELRRFDVFEHLTRIPEFFPPLAIIAFAALGLRGLSGRPLPRWQTIALVTGVSFVAAEMVKSQLKYAFGRTWPETWVNNNPSFIRDGAFGFNPFHGGAGFASFPSGHTTAICAVVSVLWICYPRYRALYVALVVAVGVGLVGANFHFLSDVIAGAFLGTSAGWLAVALWELGAHPIRPRAKIPADKLAAAARSADLVQ